MIQFRTLQMEPFARTLFVVAGDHLAVTHVVAVAICRFVGRNSIISEVVVLLALVIFVFVLGFSFATMAFGMAVVVVFTVYG